jgi:predicted transcriptional regulator
MISIEELRAALADRNILAVARETGIHSNVIYRLRAGISNPRYETFRRLVDYINKK